MEKDETLKTPDQLFNTPGNQGHAFHVIDITLFK
jgi:hypothetical protein